MPTNNNSTVEVSKDFPVPPERVYEAWTRPEQLKQWWKPMNNTLAEVTNEVKEGGTVSYVFQDNGLKISGKYLEVKEQEILVYTWNWELKEEAAKNGAYKLTVEFTAKENGSTIKIIQENLAHEEGTHPHQEGWQKGLEDLATYLSGSSDDSGPKSADSVTENTGGYNESPEQVKVAGG